MSDWISIIYLVGLTLSVIFFVITLLQKPSVEQNIVMMIAICCGLIWSGYWLGIRTTTMEGQLIAKKFNYAGACSIYFALNLFYIRYYRMKVSRLAVAAMGLVSFFFLVVTLTFDRHTWYYKSMELDAAGKLQTVYGPLHMGYVLMVLGFSLIAIVMTAHQLTLKGHQYYDWKNEVALLGVVVIPSACYLLEKVLDTQMALVPFGLLLTDIGLIYLVGGNKITDINILAREFVYDVLEDAIIIVGKDREYRGSNQIAKTIFPELEGAVFGEKIGEISERLTEIQSQAEEGKKKYIDFEGKTYAPRIRPVRGNEKNGGIVLWMEDVTAQRNNILLLENYQRDLEREVNRKTAQLKKMQVQMIHGFSTIVENKNLVTGNHIQRTSGYVEIIAREMRQEGKAAEVLTDSYLERLKMAAPLHDIGKVSIPDQILDKPARLTPEEFEVIKTHSANGALIIDRIMSESDDREYLDMAKEVATYHHEKWDGNGYPKGLSEQQIPLSARIMAVADVFDALVSARPYKEPYSLDNAFSIIQEESGRHFDPEVVAAFLHIRPEIETLFRELGNEREAELKAGNMMGSMDKMGKMAR